MTDQRILHTAHRLWAGASGLRQRRQRHKSYTYGDQWCDIVNDGKKFVREDTFIIESGKRPYSNNLIRQLVKTIVGRYRTESVRNNRSESGIAEIASRNRFADIDSRLLEEFLISGCAIQKIVCERRFNGNGVWVDNVDPRMFFVNPFKDPRGWDIEFIGMLHDMSLPEIISRYAHADRRRAETLTRIYYTLEGAAGVFAASSALGDDTGDGNDFFICSTPGKHRVIEIWSFDSSGTGNATPDFRWHCRIYSPDGHILDEYDSPYGHGSHPFAVRLYPLTDGEVHPFVEDVIDQQRYINRLVVMLDHIMSCSAKGVLLFPVEQRPKDVSWQHISDCWARADGIIPIAGRGQQLPQQVVSNAAGSGAYQLLDLQMRLFEQASGVSEALLGRNIPSNGGSQLYESQVRNATIALADLFETFSAFTDERDFKAINCRPSKKNQQKT